MFSAKQDRPTRREFLAGVAAVSAASAFPAALSAQNSAPSLCFTSAVDMAAMIRAKKLSAREALEEHLKQIDRVNPQVNAIVTLVADQATAAAARADEMQTRGEILGPLHGLPVAHKDLIETAGVRTTFGSPLFKDNVPTHDTLLVTRMRAAGAIFLGKTNVPEFGAGSQTFNRVFGATRNPYDLTKTCGGSPGGAGGVRPPAAWGRSPAAPTPAGPFAILPPGAMSSASAPPSAACPIHP